MARHLCFAVSRRMILGGVIATMDSAAVPAETLSVNRAKSLDDLGFEPSGRIFWLGSQVAWAGTRVSGSAVDRAFVAAPPAGGAARVLATMADDRTCEPVPGAGVMVTQVGDSGAALIVAGSTLPTQIGQALGGMDALSACVQRTGTTRLALAQQGFEVTGLAVRGATTIACRMGDDGRSEVWRINGAQRELLASVAWPLAHDNLVLEFQAFDEACLIDPSSLQRRPAELRTQFPVIPLLRVMPDGTTGESWIDRGSWNAEGGARDDASLGSASGYLGIARCLMVKVTGVLFRYVEGAVLQTGSVKGCLEKGLVSSCRAFACSTACGPPKARRNTKCSR